MKEVKELSKKEKEKIVEKIISEYAKSEVVLSEMLDTLSLEDVSIKDTVDIYGKASNIIYGDKVFIRKEGTNYSHNNW